MKRSRTILARSIEHPDSGKFKLLLSSAGEKCAAGLLLINSLSLDAPLIALAWLDVVSRQLDVRCASIEWLLLFLIVWLTYAGDRLLDTHQRQWTSSTLPRHQFAARHQRVLAILWLALALLTASLSLVYVPTHVLGIAGGLAAAVALYFAGCFLFPRQARSLIPREMVVALLFTTAIFFFPLVETQTQFAPLPAPDRLRTGGMFLLLVSIAFCNCLGISCWERREDEQSGEVTLATRWPQWSRYYRFLVLVTAFLTSFLWLQGYGLSSLLAGTSACLVGLGLLDSFPMNHQLKPILADLTLLLLWLLA